MTAAQRHRKMRAEIRRQRRRETAFSLIELMLGVTIMAILAAIGAERYSAYVAQTRRSEALAAIDGIWNAQEAFYAEHGVYNKNFRHIGFRMDQGQVDPLAPDQYIGKHYRYVLTVNPATWQEWMVRATSGAAGTQDIDGDDFPDVLVSGKFESFEISE